MRINNTQLNKQLENFKDNKMLPVYLVSGDEPLQLNEACDKIRQTSRNLDYTERLVFHVETGFDWDTLLTEANMLSLFSEKRLIELRIPNGKPGDKGSKAIIKYLDQPPDDTILLIISGKIDKRSCASKWFTKIDKTGLICQIWPLDLTKVPHWIEQRFRTAKLIPTEEACIVLSDCTEGNLLAAAQEIEKLSLLYNKPRDGRANDRVTNISTEEVLACVSDNSRYTVFDLVEAALSGNPARTSRILHSLCDEGVEAPIILWALNADIRQLGIMRAEVDKGMAIDLVLGKHHIWNSRKPLLGKCLQQHRAVFWQRLLIKSGHVDRVIKGAETGNIKDELLQLSIMVAGVNVFKTATVSRKTA